MQADERAARQRKMGGRWRGDRHRLDLGVVDHLRPILIQPDRSELARRTLSRALSRMSDTATTSNLGSLEKVRSKFRPQYP